MQINHSTLEDIPVILDRYADARATQTAHNVVVWPVLGAEFIAKEIAENRQYKLVVDGEVACVWVITYDDAAIWGEKDQADAIYIHRIATNPKFAGRGFVRNIVEWAKEHAQAVGRKFVRLDTLGPNHRLIAHYTAHGFQYLGVRMLTDTAGLPKHYQDENRCQLFELEV
jgi:ribosomal protein S18 acetylase RimI-like enzyme